MYHIQSMAFATAIALSGAFPVYADSLGNTSQATSDAAEASVRLVAAGGQVALGAVALPLAAAGAITGGAGDVATEISEDLWQTANAPLSVDERVLMPQAAPDLSDADDEE